MPGSNPFRGWSRRGLSLVLVLAAAGCDRGAQLRDASDDAAPDDAALEATADAPAREDVADDDASLDATQEQDVPTADAPAPTDAPTDATPPTDGGCTATVAMHPPTPANHVPEGTRITWSTNPPSSGDHYGTWARWAVHNMVVPRGYWVHNLEHGGVAVLYRCGADCATVRAQLESLVRSLPGEPMCLPVGRDLPRRVLLTEDPELDVPVAAAAWGYTYRAGCVDPASLRAFVLDRTGHAPEDTCAEGSYP